MKPSWFGAKRSLKRPKFPAGAKLKLAPARENSKVLSSKIPNNFTFKPLFSLFFAHKPYSNPPPSSKFCVDSGKRNKFGLKCFCEAPGAKNPKFWLFRNSILSKTISARANSFHSKLYLVISSKLVKYHVRTFKIVTVTAILTFGQFEQAWNNFAKIPYKVFLLTSFRVFVTIFGSIGWKLMIFCEMSLSHCYFSENC